MNQILSVCSQTSEGSKSWRAFVHSLFCFSTSSGGLTFSEQSPVWSVAMVSQRSIVPQWEDTAQCENASSRECAGPMGEAAGINHQQRMSRIPRQRMACAKVQRSEVVAECQMRYVPFESRKTGLGGGRATGQICPPAFFFDLYPLLFVSLRHPSAVGTCFPDILLFTRPPQAAALCSANSSFQSLPSGNTPDPSPSSLGSESGGRSLTSWSWVQLARRGWGGDRELEHFYRIRLSKGL